VFPGGKAKAPATRNRGCQSFEKTKSPTLSSLKSSSEDLAERRLLMQTACHIGADLRDIETPNDVSKLTAVGENSERHGLLVPRTSNLSWRCKQSAR